jgi:hypothetical protein
MVQKEVQRVVYSGGASEEKHYLLVKMLNQKGIEDWKEYWVPAYSGQGYTIEKAEVLKGNGDKVKADIDNRNIIFTKLEVGDAIAISYRIKNYGSGKLAHQFDDDFYFKYWMPYQHVKYSLLIAPDVPFKYQFTKQPIVPQKSKVEDFDMYVWEQKDDSGLVYEDKMPELEDASNVLYISSFPDWKYISNWYYDLASTKATDDPEVKEAVKKILDGKGNIPALEKAKLFQNYIAENISYSSVPFRQSNFIPQKASKVLNTRLGDCKDVSTLFVAMCKEAGIKADWVLVNTRDNGYERPLLPSIDFNHCIAHLVDNGKDYFIELTSPYLPFNAFPEGLHTASALVIHSEKDSAVSKLIHIDPSTGKRDEVVRTSEATIVDNALLIKNTNFKTGNQAAAMRSSYRDEGTKEQFKNMQQAITASYANAELKDLSFKNLKGVSDTVFYDRTYSIPESVTEVAGMKLLTIPWGDKSDSKSVSTVSDRQFPMDLWYYSMGETEKEVFTLTLPTGMQLSAAPARINISCAIAEYSIDYKLTGGKLMATRSMRYKKAFVDVSEVKNYNDFLKKVVSADAKPIALK